MKPKLELYEVTYNGSWLGGSALVLAYNEEQALELVKNDATTTNFTDVTVAKSKHKLKTPAVLQNDNGEY